MGVLTLGAGLGVGLGLSEGPVTANDTKTTASQSVQGAANASGALKSGKEVTVWMRPDANTHEIHAVKALLAQLSYLRQPCAYWNKARNFTEARTLLPTEVIRGLTVKEMPTSFRCTPVASVDADKVIRTMDSALGVLTVTISPPNLDREQDVQRH